jgi:hypothetical protein
VEVKFEDLQEDRCDNGAQCWLTSHGLRDSEEHLCHRRTFCSQHLPLFTAANSNLQDPVMGGQLAAEWGTRETFIAVVTTNLPMIFPLLKVWFAPLLPSSFSNSNKKAYKTPGSGFVSIGGGRSGGTGGASSRNRAGGKTTSHISANRTFDNESEEHIVKRDGDVKMTGLHPAGSNIVVRQQVSITTEDRRSNESGEYFHVV